MGTAAATAWMDLAACRGADRELFFPADFEDPADEARRVCGRCPVRAECLAWARAAGERGFWGGTTELNREQLGRPRRRVRCVGCGSRELLRRAGVYQICLGCGLSWLTVHTRMKGEAA